MQVLVSSAYPAHFPQLRNMPIQESEESEEIVEPYQYEPHARVIGRSLPATKEDDDGTLGGGRLGNTVCY